MFTGGVTGLMRYLIQISDAVTGIAVTGTKSWTTFDLSLAMQQMLMANTLMADSQVGDKQEYQYV